MAWDPTATVKAIQSALKQSGYFPGGVRIGDVFSPPTDTSAAVMFGSLAPARTTLASSVDIWTFIVRVYDKAMDPSTAETVELKLGNMASKVEAALAAGYTLDGTVRAIDWVGEERGGRLKADWGHITIGNVAYRAVNVSVPVIVDDSAIFIS